MSWPMVKLGDVAPATPVKNVNLNKDELIWQLNLDQIESNTGKVIDKIKQPLSKAGSSTHFFNNEHVLYSKLRPYLNKVIIPDELGIATTELVPMKPDQKRLNKKYLAYYLRSKQFVDWISTQVSGAKMPRVVMSIFWQHEMPLPPIAEQERIVAILDKANGILHKRKKIKKLADNFLDATFFAMFGDPVVNDKKWSIKKLNDICDNVIDCSHSTPKWVDDGIICVRTSNLSKGGWIWSDSRFVNNETYLERTKRSIVEKGDIILSREGTVGVAAIVPENLKLCMGQRLVQLKLDKNKVTPEYLLAFLLYELDPVRISRVMSGSTSKHINVSELRQLDVMLPPMREQKLFSEIRNKIINIYNKPDIDSSLFEALSSQLTF
ncbi:restriction endonuclease [Pantoea sp. ICBG 1758]|uniref:restriction endonuclease subunit S n=1 Tax=Pantoea sp. ICBG 1758 TaxID=2071682 RepID=UPI000CE4959F|nr:restriction endonuclease subunit S [Pantoea sp. ICBG 1758]PPC62446.1 restriction endonuclease [Pantoea sp. ICBG 1758]